MEENKVNETHLPCVKCWQEMYVKRRIFMYRPVHIRTHMSAYNRAHILALPCAV